MPWMHERQGDLAVIIQELMTELKFLSFDLILMILDSYYFGFNSDHEHGMELQRKKKYIY